MSRRGVYKREDRQLGVLLDQFKKGGGRVVAERRAHFRPDGSADVIRWEAHCGWDAPEEWEHWSANSVQAFAAAAAVQRDERPYACGVCGANGVKLWRQYQWFADSIRLLCAPCALVDQKAQGPVDDGGWLHDASIEQRTDQIGSLIPAVPAPSRTYWGYTSVPQERVEWWRALPTYPPARRPA